MFLPSKFSHPTKSKTLFSVPIFATYLIFSKYMGQSIPYQKNKIQSSISKFANSANIQESPGNLLLRPHMSLCNENYRIMSKFSHPSRNHGNVPPIQIFSPHQVKNFVFRWHRDWNVGTEGYPGWGRDQCPLFWSLYLLSTV